ncbi:DUF499 domain-containing protein [Mycobacterium sp. pW049]|uniref:DUF499 domain-containing protein n=1 Tax=[Mycobacterium] bulgaricum TaxID=3238985 RepID=UPI00351B0C67
MASLTNKERVGRVLDLVAQGLGPWMVTQLHAKYGDTWATEVGRTAGLTGRDTSPNQSDPAYLFWVFDKQWHAIFKTQLSFEDKRAVSTLWDARKEWAHGERISSERTERVLMDGEHILRAVGAVQQADRADEMRREFRRLMFEEDQKRLQRAQEKALSVQVESTGLPAWRDVVEPHDDVARGTFELAQFAADLRQVHQGIAGPEYGDPAEFFGRTYLTRGLRYLLEQAIKRLTGGGGEPVVDLMTTFGGGKTHSLLAVYHAAAGNPAEKLPGMRELLDGIGVAELPAMVHRAVLVGNDLSILGMPKPDGVTVNTLWGELAYQLGGKSGYELVARYDEQSVPPTTTAIADLLTKYSPCIVLIDEWVAYLRQLWSRESPAPAGTFDGHMTFVQSLTEAVKSVPTALLVVSLPASDVVRDIPGDDDGPIENEHEVGGTAGLEALRHLRSVIHRVESAWQPATIEESFEIVRRRIFKPFGREQDAARDLVVQKFTDHYLRYSGDVPSEVMQPGYRTSMRTAYPIHPELFDRLYKDWSTLERFQRTRGVLRLMATVVYALWISGDRSPMILPASIPLDSAKVFDELANHLDDSWKPIVDADVAGETSTANIVDSEIKILGKSMATKRAARCVFLGTAPMANLRQRDGSAATIRGIEQKRVVLGSTYPGDNPAHVTDGLRRLGDLGKYMNRDQDRYWLSLQQTVAQIVQERADSYHDDQVFDELAGVVRQETDKGLFERVHRFPHGSIDVEDDPGIGLVIFGPDRSFSKRGRSVAEDAALEFLSKRGTNARIHKNSLVFLAPEVDRIDVLLNAVRQRMAWEYILESKDSLNLDQHNVKVAESRVAQAKQTVSDSIREAYRWILVPTQEPGSSSIELESILMSGDGTLAERVTKKADAGEFVVRSFSPSLLRMQINRLNLWKDKPYVPLDTLVGYFSQYVYMPKVVRPKVVMDVAWHLDEVLSIELDGFAYADSFDDDRFVGLTVTKPGAVRQGGLLVEPTVALEQIEKDKMPDGGGAGRTGTATVAVGPTGGAGETGTSVGVDAATATTVPTRFHATKELTNSRVVRDVGHIYEEIVSHFVDGGLSVQVSIDIESSQLDKLTDDQRAAIRENLKTLGFGPDDWSMD